MASWWAREEVRGVVVISSGRMCIIPLGRALKPGRGLGVQSRRKIEDFEQRRNLMKTVGRTW